MIRRLVALISNNACLEAEREAAMKQAASASRAAESLIDSAGGGSGKGEEKKVKELETQLKESQIGKDHSVSTHWKRN